MSRPQKMLKSEPPPAESKGSAASRGEGKLRYSKVWWTVGWLFVAGVLWGSLSPDQNLPVHLGSSDKIVHFSAYCTMAFWFAGMTDRRRYPFLALLLLILGALIEVAQGTMGFGRSADWRDFIANASGVGVALLLAYAGLGTWMGRVERRLGLS